MNGHPVSEAQIDDWVAEAEHGYDVEALRRRGRPAVEANPRGPSRCASLMTRSTASTATRIRMGARVPR